MDFGLQEACLSVQALDLFGAIAVKVSLLGRHAGLCRACSYARHVGRVDRRLEARGVLEGGEVGQVGHWQATRA